MIAELSMSTIEMAALLSKPSSAWTAACSNSPFQYSAAPSALCARACQGDAGSVSSPIARWPPPAHRPEPVESERPLQEPPAENSNDRMPSGSGPTPPPR